MSWDGRRTDARRLLSHRKEPANTNAGVIIKRMLIILSPAKKLNFNREIPVSERTLPQFADRARELLDVLRDYDAASLSRLMQLSEKLSVLNTKRYHNFTFPLTAENSRPAVYCFDGDVYLGLNIDSLTVPEVFELQKKLRIISGLFGLLRPLDLIQPYRLEMGTKLPTSRGDTLYQFWGNTLADSIYAELSADVHEDRDRFLVNLASDEYATAVRIPDLRKRGLRVIQPMFRDYKNGTYKTISFFAKKARGMMVHYLIRNNITKEEDILGFDVGGYVYSRKHSQPDSPVFLRKLSAAA